MLTEIELCRKRARKAIPRRAMRNARARNPPGTEKSYMHGRRQRSTIDALTAFQKHIFVPAQAGWMDKIRFATKRLFSRRTP